MKNQPRVQVHLLHSLLFQGAKEEGSRWQGGTLNDNEILFF